MAIKKRPRVKVNLEKETSPSSPALGKLAMVFFLVFVILATIIFFRAPEKVQTFVTGKALSSIELEKSEYNLSERLKGIVTVQMEPGDVLPPNTTFEIFISTNLPDCQLRYICPNGIAIPWHNYTDGQCVEIDPDPESSCCFLMGASCAQVILNSKFKAPLGGLKSWFAFPYGTNPSSIFIEDLIDPVTYNITMEKALVLDPTDISYSGINLVSSSVQQILSNRQFVIKELVPANARVEIGGTNNLKCNTGSVGPAPPQGGPLSLPPCNNNASYNATMFAYGSPVQDAQYNWSISNDSVATLNATTGRFVKLLARAPGWVTIQVTASVGNEIATAFKQVCIYRTDPIAECSSAGITYSSSNMNLQGLYLQGSEAAGGGAGGYWLQNTENRGNIKWQLAYTTATATAPSDGCAFEVLVKGKTVNDAPRNLHYWYQLRQLAGCTMPQSNATDKYISMPLPSMNTVANYTRNLYLNWTNSFGAGSREDIITEIQIIAYGYWDGTTVHSQRVYFDNFELWKKESSYSNSCTGQNKICCAKGAGLGSYLGDQFKCSRPGEKCYERCAPFIAPRNFEQFKALSSTPGKFNRTMDKCRVIVSGTEIDLRDYCYPGHAGEGFTACLDTSNTSSTPLGCRGWDNLYIINLNHPAFNNFKLAQNGTYSLTMRISYNHFETPENCSEGCLNYGEESCRDYCIISEVSAPFSVGVVGITPTCQDTDYNCYNAPIISETNFSECINGIQTKTRTLNCTYIGTAVCPKYKAIVQTVSQNCTVSVPCTENDYSCNSWQPTPCSPQSTQTRTCQLTGTCDPNATSSTAPTTERPCDTTAIIEYVQTRYQEGMTRTQMKQQLQQFGWSNEDITMILNQVYGTEEKPSLGWVLYLVIGIIVVVAIVVIIVFVVPSVKKGAKAKAGAGAGAEAYPELTSYIKDALAAGATKQEIIAKLQEAGWPKEAIEASFKAAQA